MFPADKFPLLVGNSFPLSLIRRRLLIEPRSMEELRRAAEGRRIFSFWGHAETQAEAEAATGLDLAPRRSRPVLALSPEGLPMLDGERFRECWVVSPDYRRNFRPAAGCAGRSEDIAGWQALHLCWLEREKSDEPL